MIDYHRQLFSLLSASLLFLPLANAAAKSQEAPISVGNISLGNGGDDSGYPSSIAINHVTNTIYVASRNSNTVHVIDSLFNAVIKTITVGFGPIDLAVNSDTNVVYVAITSTNTVAVIDGARNEVAATIDFAVYPSGAIRGIAVNKESNKVYVLINDSRAAFIATIDGLTNKVEGKFKVADLRPDVDVMENELVKTIPVSDPQGIAVDSQTNTVYVVSYASGVVTVNGITYSVESTVPVGKFPEGAAFQPTGYCTLPMHIQIPYPQ